MALQSNLFLYSYSNFSYFDKLAFHENIITTVFNVSDHIICTLYPFTYMRKYFDYVSLSAEQASNVLGDAIALSWGVSNFNLFSNDKIGFIFMWSPRYRMGHNLETGRINEQLLEKRRVKRFSFVSPHGHSRGTGRVRDYQLTD